MDELSIKKGKTIRAMELLGKSVRAWRAGLEADLGLPQRVFVSREVEMVGALGHRTTLNELHEAIAVSLERRCVGFNGRDPQYRDFRIGGVPHPVGDIEKARSLLGYEPSQCIREGLTQTIEYYLKFKV